ncbi:MAG: sigma-70 family RNA polymerase sigma factor [Acidobacteriota bacterium]
MPTFHFRDKALVKRLLRGDERAFERFFSDHFAGLYRFAASRLRDDAAAEEVAQATLCQAIRKLATYRGEASLFTWLCTFCRHEIAAHVKRNRRIPEPIGFVEDIPEVRAALESVLGDDEGPAADLRRRELARRVRATLDRLPAHYGRALEWKYLEESSVAEIAARLDLGPKAAESLLTRARAAFRDAYRELASDPLTALEPT